MHDGSHERQQKVQTRTNINKQRQSEWENYVYQW